MRDVIGDDLIDIGATGGGQAAGGGDDDFVGGVDDGGSSGEIGSGHGAMLPTSSHRRPSR